MERISEISLAASKWPRGSKMSLQVKLVTPIYYMTKFQGTFVSQISLMSGGGDDKQDPLTRFAIAPLVIRARVSRILCRVFILDCFPFLNQIAESVAKSEASRDPDAIPDPNDPPPVYVGYDYRGDGKANEKRVKKLMADINKSGALRRPRTIF